MSPQGMAGFGGSPESLFGGVIFTAVLAWASVFDIRTRRIPNALVAVLALLGVSYSALLLPVGAGVQRALMGMGVGFGLWIPFYMLRMLGAGDVKLFAAPSCW